MRLKLFKKVDFPQPEGPIRAVIRFFGDLDPNIFEGVKRTVIEVTVLCCELHGMLLSFLLCVRLRTRRIGSAVRFDCGADDDGQDHDRQRDAAREHGVAPIKGDHEDQIAEQTVNDAGNARKRFGRYGDETDERAAAVGVFREKDGGRDSDRNGDHGRDGDQLQGADEGWQERGRIWLIPTEHQPKGKLVCAVWRTHRLRSRRATAG